MTISAGWNSFERVYEHGRVLAELQGMSQDAAKLAASPLWPLTDDDLTGCLHAAHHLEQAAAALQAQLVRQAVTRGLPAAQCHRSTTGWLRSLLRIDPQPARELSDAADVLGRLPGVEQAVLDGQVDLRQATVIAAAVDAVSTGLAESDEVSLAEATAVTRHAESVLVEMAGRLPAYQLRRIGERILDHVAPEVADRVQQTLLARQEARAHARRHFSLSLPVDGMVRLSGALGVEDAATVQAALHPLCTPAAAGDDSRSPGQRRADALAEVCRLALRTGQLPDDGGQPPQLAVTVAYDALTQTLGTAVTDTGERLSATTARRLACDARILPVVLGGAGQILDVGRARRLATGALRQALHVRDQGCAFPDCDRPPRWTDAHHITAWTNGGPTDLDNLVLLCGRHHRLIHGHTAGWKVRMGADRRPDFIPPPTVDPDQQPRRNLYHPRV
jgi:hypothetical protein